MDTTPLRIKLKKFKRLKDHGIVLAQKRNAWRIRLSERIAKDKAAAGKLNKGNDIKLIQLRDLEVQTLRAKSEAAAQKIEELASQLTQQEPTDIAALTREMASEATNREEWTTKATMLQAMTLDEFQGYCKDTFHVHLDMMDESDNPLASSPSPALVRMTTHEIKMELSRAQVQLDNNSLMQQKMEPFAAFWSSQLEDEIIFTEWDSLLAAQLSPEFEVIKDKLIDFAIIIKRAARDCVEIVKLLIDAVTVQYHINNAKPSSSSSSGSATDSTTAKKGSNKKELPRSDQWRMTRGKNHFWHVSKAYNGDLTISAKIGNLNLKFISPLIHEAFGMVIALNREQHELSKFVYGGEPVVSATKIKSPVPSPTTTINANVARSNAPGDVDIGTAKERLSFGGSGAKTGGAGEGAGVQKKPSKSRSSKKKNKKNGGRK